MYDNATNTMIHNVTIIALQQISNTLELIPTGDIDNSIAISNISNIVSKASKDIDTLVSIYHTIQQLHNKG